MQPYLIACLELFNKLPSIESFGIDMLESDEDNGKQTCEHAIKHQQNQNQQLRSGLELSLMRDSIMQNHNRTTIHHWRKGKS
jgi:hypothetical protein